VQQTTKEVAKKQMQKAEEDAEIMVGVMQESSKKLETKLEKETKAREKQDKEIIGLQSKISELMVQLESKTTDNTVEEVETMVSVMQEKIRKEKVERSKSEKEIQLMREEMSMMQLEMNKEKEIIETWITNEEVIDKHFAEVNAVEVREEAEESAAANEKMLQETKAKMAKMQSIVSKFDKKMEADQKKRLEHETAVNLLQGQTRELFERSAANSQRISALEEKCSAKVDELKKAINGLATRLQVSQTSSGGDLARLDKVMQEMVARLTSEVQSRKVGDTRNNAAIISQVKALIARLESTMKSSRSMSRSSSACKCVTKVINGERTKECTRNGEVVPSCGSSSSSSSSSSRSSSSGSSSSSSGSSSSGSSSSRSSSSRSSSSSSSRKTSKSSRDLDALKD